MVNPPLPTPKTFTAADCELIAQLLGRDAMKAAESTGGYADPSDARWEAIRMLRAFAASLDHSGWQEMDSAPKDGRPILVFMRDDAMSRAWQYEDGDPSKLVALASWTRHNGGGWVSYHPGVPTLWQPLPPLPLAPATRETE